MLKIAQITDLHLLPQITETILEVNTWDTYTKVINLVKQKKYDALIATGDIAEDGHMESYGNFILGLKDLNCPLYYALGNHDKAVPFVQITKIFPVIKHEKCVVSGTWCFIMLNSAVKYHDEGALSEEELIFLQNSIQEHPDKHIAIFLHHNPVRVNSAFMDACMLENPAMLLDIVNAHKNVKLVCFGHVHQDFSERRGHVSFLGSPATSFQFKKQRAEFEIDDKSTPGYREIIFNDDGSFATSLHYLAAENS